MRDMSSNTSRSTISWRRARRDEIIAMGIISTCFFSFSMLGLHVPFSVDAAFVHSRSSWFALKPTAKGSFADRGISGIGTMQRPKQQKQNIHMMLNNKSRRRYMHLAGSPLLTSFAVKDNNNNNSEDQNETTGTAGDEPEQNEDSTATDVKSKEDTSELNDTASSVVGVSDTSTSNGTAVLDSKGINNVTATNSGNMSAIDVEVEVEHSSDDSDNADTVLNDALETEDERQEQQQRQQQVRINELRQRATSYASQLSLSEILGRLDKRGLRYAPSSSQDELEAILVDALVSEKTGRGRNSDERARTLQSKQGRQGDARSGNIDRTRRRVVGDAEASRYRRSSPEESQYDRRQARRRRQQRRREQDKISRTVRDVAEAASNAVEPVDRVVSETLWGVTSGVGKRAQRVGRRAKKVVGATVDVAGNVVDNVGDVVGGVKKKATRRGSKRVIRVDENGIAEPDWSYVWQEGEDEEQDMQEEKGGYSTGSDEYNERSDERINGSRRAPRRKRQSRRAAPPSRDKSMGSDENDEFTWADYAIPFHTKAGSPGGPRGRNRRRPEDSSYRRPRRRPSRGLESLNRDEDDGARMPPPRRRRPARSSPDPSPLDSKLFILPPASSDVMPFPSAEDESGESIDDGEVRRNPNKDKGTKQRPPRRRRDRGDGRDRKVYSAWPEYDPDQGDIIDQVGNKMAEAAETFLWGSDDGTEEQTTMEDEERRTNRRSRRRRTRKDDDDEDDDPYEEDPPPKRHWRDRLADRLDAAMGVHEQGSYYQEWADRIEMEEDTKVGSDPEDWVMGRHKIQRRMGLTPEERQRERSGRRRDQVATGGRNRGNSGGVDAYFWSNDGNIMSALLGRTPTGQKVSMDKLFAQPLGPNIVTTLLRSAFQFALAAFANACRWASVRGSLPQPIVVFFLSVAFICAPKGKRVLSAGITLFALRAMAEALHGYVYGDDGWEDDPDHLYYHDDDIEDDLADDDDAEEIDASLPDGGERRRGRRRNSRPYPAPG